MWSTSSMPRQFDMVQWVPRHYLRCILKICALLLSYLEAAKACEKLGSWSADGRVWVHASPEEFRNLGFWGSSRLRERLAQRDYLRVVWIPRQERLLNGWFVVSVKRGKIFKPIFLAGRKRSCSSISLQVKYHIQSLIYLSHAAPSVFSTNFALTCNRVTLLHVLFRIVSCFYMYKTTVSGFQFFQLT